MAEERRVERMRASIELVAPMMARGRLLTMEGIDFDDVVIALHDDDATRVRAWLDEGRLKVVDDDTWRAWVALQGDALEVAIVQPFVVAQVAGGAES